MADWQWETDDDFYRPLEMDLRMRLYYRQHLQHDNVIEADIEKITPPHITVDWEATECSYDRLQELFNGILKVEKKLVTGDFHRGPSMDILAKWRGIHSRATPARFRRRSRAPKRYVGISHYGCCESGRSVRPLVEAQSCRHEPCRLQEWVRVAREEAEAAA